MRMSRFSRRFHDPWGNRSGNRFGTITKFQYQVGKTSLNSFDYSDDRANIDRCRWYVDRPHMHEHTGTRFLRAGKNCVEKLRR